MKFFKKNKGNYKAEIQTVQPRASNSHPFNLISGYRPTSDVLVKVYRSLREAVPIVDAALSKIVRLMGGFSVECGDNQVQAGIMDFLSNVQVNACGRGINEFINVYLNQLITYGTSVGEIIVDGESKEVAALYNACLDDVQLRTGESPLNLIILSKNEDGEFVPIKYPELVVVSALNPDPGHIYGNSVLQGLPFISDILLKIYHTIGMNWERVGNVRFAVTYKPSSESSERAYAKERASQIAKEWSKAMRDIKHPSDFVAVGDVSIKVIGADNQDLDSQIPVRQMLEQIVSKLSIPPFLLGLSWSTTETMSTQQSDMLTSELDAYRRVLDPIIYRVCSIWQRLKGYDEDLKIVWNSVNLKDELRNANTRLTMARAREIESKLDEK